MPKKKKEKPPIQLSLIKIEDEQAVKSIEARFANHLDEITKEIVGNTKIKSFDDLAKFLGAHLKGALIDSAKSAAAPSLNDAHGVIEDRDERIEELESDEEAVLTVIQHHLRERRMGLKSYNPEQAMEDIETVLGKRGYSVV